MADKITTLHPKNDASTNIYPNIKAENIPSSSVNLAKLSNDIKTTLASVSSKLDESTILALLNNIKTNLTFYGIDFNYTYENGTWTTSFDNMNLQWACEYLWDFTQHFVVYQRIGNHFVGYIELEVNEQIPSLDELLKLDNQSEYPRVNMYMNAWKNRTPCVAMIDTDGNISVNTGLDEYDVLTIKFDWWL